ncbi:MAG: T9SS type A sorting domain-containing protein, partial [Flavobacterium sp.]
APGGTFEIAEFGGGDPTLDDFIDNLAIDKFCFIPTLSSMAVSNANWYANVSGAGASPFENSFVPAVNEPHVTLTADNVAFALSEIFIPLNVNEVTISSIQVKNPVGTSLEVYFPQSISDANLILRDLSGKTLWNEFRTTWQGYENININLSSGVYLFEIHSQNNRQIMKLIKN